MRLVGSAGQRRYDRLFDGSGTTAGGHQLILPERLSTSYLYFQNTSDTDMFLETGSARATCTISGGKVNSVSITNGGFNFTIPPDVVFLGGGNTGWNMANPTFLGCGQPGYPSPSNSATGSAVLGSGIVTSISINNGGASYAKAPYVLITNSVNDPFGCADPFYGSATSGFYLPGNSAFAIWESSTTATTDPIAIYCASSGKNYVMKWMD